MSDAVVIALIGALLPAVAAGIFAWQQTRRSASVAANAARVAAEAQERIASVENLQRFLDQLQEQLAAERSARVEDAARNRVEILELRSDVTLAMRGIRVRDSYIFDLRRHISEGNPPPPPGWPAELVA